ncbi:hypothetical protein MtrunA17_Chr5g0435831 [Medicago truncatula]|uniref:Transmembrane protein n=1 Tax=Medicago truncatula TaxID=3880 RepID=A0A396HUJ8_MEDTR|nr:hypothetical protein MtrunA17_Chr5g0435831 [Medicago truncatula]
MNAVQLQLQGRRRRRVVTRIITSSTLFFLGLFKKFSTMIFAATMYSSFVSYSITLFLFFLALHFNRFFSRWIISVYRSIPLYNI